MEVTREDVLRCAQLTDLSLEAEEIEPLRRDMERLLSHAESLNGLSLEGVEPTVHGPGIALLRREDRARPGFSQEEALANAPDSENGFFRVPKVIG